MSVSLKLGQPDDVYVSVLLHDIGKVVLWINFNADCVDILYDCNSDRQRLIELISLFWHS